MYTHEIKYNLGDGVFLTALVGKDSKGNIVYKFVEASQPLPKVVVESFVTLTDFAVKEVTKHSDLQEISITSYKEEK